MTSIEQSGSGTFLGTRLSVMMFLQFFIWGAWYVTVGNYMGEHGMGDYVYWAYTVGPIAAIISPFFLGMVADRFFATERVLAVLHLLGGIAMLLAPLAGSVSPLLFIIVLGLHMLCYMPTLGLTNSEAFHHVTNQERQFPIIRVFGTIGWIVANWVVSAWLHADKEPTQFYVTAGACFALGIFSFSLPHTPPPAAGRKVTIKEVLGFDALRQLASVSFFVFLASSFLICIPLAAYYSYAPVFADTVGFKDVAFNMSFGQIAEIVFMVAMPLFFAMLGVKWMLLVGMLAWVVRYGLFAGAASNGVLWMVVGGILLHGICYDFFFVTGFIYTDKKCTPQIRGQAQGLLVLVTQGLGLGIGAQVIGKLRNGLMADNHDELVAQAGALRSEVRALDQLQGALESLREQAQFLPEMLRTQAEQLWQQAEPLFIGTAEKWQESTQIMLQASDWRMTWLIPCIAAAVIMVLFFILFKNDSADGQEVPQGEG